MIEKNVSRMSAWPTTKRRLKKVKRNRITKRARRIPPTKIRSSKRMPKSKPRRRSKTKRSRIKKRKRRIKRRSQKTLLWTPRPRTNY
jgi:hypothetical protein